MIRSIASLLVLVLCGPAVASSLLDAHLQLDTLALSVAESVKVAPVGAAARDSTTQDTVFANLFFDSPDCSAKSMLRVIMVPAPGMDYCRFAAPKAVSLTLNVTLKGMYLFRSHAAGGLHNAQNATDFSTCLLSFDSYSESECSPMVSRLGIYTKWECYNKAGLTGLTDVSTQYLKRYPGIVGTEFASVDDFTGAGCQAANQDDRAFVSLNQCQNFNIAAFPISVKYFISANKTLVQSTIYIGRDCVNSTSVWSSPLDDTSFRNSIGVCSVKDRSDSVLVSVYPAQTFGRDSSASSLASMGLGSILASAIVACLFSL
jgi:hypothetical protein